MKKSYRNVLKKYGGNIWFQCALASISLIVLVFYYYNGFNRYSDYLLNSLEGPLRYDDVELIQYVKEKILESPSKEPYKLKIDIPMKHQSEIFYQNFTKIFFKNKKNGFFIEAGALDGQSMSNTLGLEMKQGWTGLLIEPNPANYIALKRKNRKAWTANACLSLHKYPKLERLKSSDMVQNRQFVSDIRQRAMDSIAKESENSVNSDSKLGKNSYYIIQCIPLASFLLALNVSRVDLLSLDVEFVEEDVIRSFDFERFDIQVIFMEWWHLKRLQWLRKFMESKGYVFIANTFGDIIFAREKSQYAKDALKAIGKRTFVHFYFPENKTNEKEKT